MAKIAIPTKKDQSNGSANETHKKTVAHLKQASKMLLEAARHHEKKNYEKATKSTKEANGHLRLASNAQRTDLKLQELENQKKITAHLKDASGHLLEAARYHEGKKYEKATQSTIAAHGHLSLANQTQKEDEKALQN